MNSRDSSKVLLSPLREQELMKTATNQQYQCVRLQPQTVIFAGESACTISFLILLHKEQLLLSGFTDDSNT